MILAIFNDRLRSGTHNAHYANIRQARSATTAFFVKLGHEPSRVGHVPGICVAQLARRSAHASPVYTLGIHAIVSDHCRI
jgi:hypothetical protein